MHDPAGVRVRDRVHDFDRVVNRRVDFEPAVARNQLGERRAVDVLENDIRVVSDEADFVHATDRRMVERRGDPRFFQQHPVRLSIAPAVIDELDGDLPLQLVVVCQVDDAHAAGAEHGFDAITAHVPANLERGCTVRRRGHLPARTDADIRIHAAGAPKQSPSRLPCLPALISARRPRR